LAREKEKERTREARRESETALEQRQFNGMAAGPLERKGRS